MTVLLLNPKQLDTQISEIREHLETNNKVIFIEVTNLKVVEEFKDYYCGYFIDPQHTIAGRGGLTSPAVLFKGLSAVKYTVERQKEISDFMGVMRDYNILYVVEKPDMDSVSTLTLLQWLEQDLAALHNLSTETLQRIEDIHEVDCFVMPTEWSAEHFQDHSIKWTNILGASISDFKQSIETRVGYMIDYLLEGKLHDFYRTQVESDWKLLEQAMVETHSGVVCVSTPARGASSLIYKQAPVGIAYCENFQGKGPKFSVMQFTEGYAVFRDLTLSVKGRIPKFEAAPATVNIEGFYSHMNRHFPEESGTWGGNVSVGGSPVPCSLSVEQVAKELAKFIITD